MARTNRLTLLQQIDEERERAAKRFEEWGAYARNLGEAHTEAIAALNAEHQADLLRQEKSHAEQIRNLTAKHRKEVGDGQVAHTFDLARIQDELIGKKSDLARLRTFLEDLLELDPELERFRVDGDWAYVNVKTAVNHLRNSRLVDKYRPSVALPTLTSGRGKV